MTMIHCAWDLMRARAVVITAAIVCLLPIR
jgi:hypothetical protein